jgi:hypothetical protein
LRYPQLFVSLPGLSCLGTEDLGKEVSNLWGPMLQVLAHKDQFCFRLSLSRWGI